MNGAWLPGIAGALGLLINIIWTVVNLSMRADLARQIAELKDWMATEYITREVFDLRMNAAFHARDNLAASLKIP